MEAKNHARLGQAPLKACGPLDFEWPHKANASRPLLMAT